MENEKSWEEIVAGMEEVLSRAGTRGLQDLEEINSETKSDGVLDDEAADEILTRLSQNSPQADSDPEARGSDRAHTILGQIDSITQT